MCTLVRNVHEISAQVYPNVCDVNHKIYDLSIFFPVPPVWDMAAYSLYTVTSKQCPLYYCLPSIDLCSTQYTFSVTLCPLRRNTARLIPKRHLSSATRKCGKGGVGGVPYISPIQYTALWNVKLLSEWMRLFTESSKTKRITNNIEWNSDTCDVCC